MKKLSLIAVIAIGSLLACCTIANAQDANKDAKKGGKGRFTVEQRMERLTTELKLTEAQQPKVKAVLEATSKNMQGLRDLPQEERRPKMKTIRDEEEKKLKEILTPEQAEKYTKLQQDMRKKAQKKSE
jgi:periplasmic protein CpxP/Spy